MSEITPEKKNSGDKEIDLLDLIRKFGNTISRWITAILKAILISFIFLAKRWLPLLISILIGIGLSFILKSYSHPFFTADIVFKNNLAQPDKITRIDNSGTTAEIISKINKLRPFCADNYKDNLATAISMKPDEVKNITDIGGFYIIDLGKDGIPDLVDYKSSFNVYDTLNVRMPTQLDIRINFSSTINLNKVRDGMISYIQNDSLYQERNRLRLHQNEDRLSRLNFDIKQLDSLQKVKYFEETRNMKPASGGQIIFMQEQRTQLVYPDIYLLYDKKQQLESERELYKNIITVLSDFSLPTRRQNGAMYYGKLVIPSVFLFTLAILIIFANKKTLIEVFKKY